MNNVYKILRDDVEIIHLGKIDDGTLLSIERKHFNFFPEVGKKVIVFQGNGEYIIAEEDTENSFLTNKKIPLKHKSTAGILALVFGFWGFHSLYLNSKHGFLRLGLGILSFFCFITIALKMDSGLYTTTFEALIFLISFAYISIMSIYVFIEGILILSSHKDSKWHKDGNGNELLD